MRRPPRLHGVAAMDQPPLPGRQVDPVDPARVSPDPWVVDALGGAGDLLAVRRPGGVEAELGDAAYRLPFEPHEEDAAAIALRAEGDLEAIRGEGRLGSVFQG